MYLKSIVTGDPWSAKDWGMEFGILVNLVKLLINYFIGFPIGMSRFKDFGRTERRSEDSNLEKGARLQPPR